MAMGVTQRCKASIAGLKLSEREHPQPSFGFVCGLIQSKPLVILQAVHEGPSPGAVSDFSGEQERNKTNY